MKVRGIGKWEQVSSFWIKSRNSLEEKKELGGGRKGKEKKGEKRRERKKEKK